MADKYTEYATKRAAAAALISSLRGVGFTIGSTKAKDYLDGMDAKLLAADAAVAPPGRDFGKAAGLVDKVSKDLFGIFKSLYVDGPKDQIKKVKASPAAAFVADDLKEIESLQADIDADIASAAWRKVILEARRNSELIGIASRVSDRRQVFELQRASTAKQLDSVKAHPPLIGQAALLEKMLAEADGMATRKTMFIEAAVSKLKEIEANCVKLLSQVKDAEAYVSERKTADDKMAALAKRPVAAKLGPVIAGIQHQLERAATLAAGGPSQDWKAARGVLGQVLADLEAAAKLADSAGDIENASAAKGDAASVKKAIGKLRADAADMAKVKPVELAKSELARVNTCLGQADAQVAGGHPDQAAPSLKAAADLLASVAVMQQQHGRFVELRKVLTDRCQALLKLPVAAAIKARIEAFAKALAQADAQDKAQAWDKLEAALGTAQEAANQAEEAARLRKEFDERSKTITDRLKAELKAAKLSAPQGKEVQGDLASAGAQAAKFDFAAAARLLDTAEARFDAAVVNALARQSPPDVARLTAGAKKIMAKGGGKLLDSLVKQLPNNVSFEALKPLAKERFGLEIKSDTGSDTVSGKKIWEMLARVPEDVVGNPSLKKVERVDPSKNGGLYDSDAEMVVMNGRPGQATQGFGSKIAKELPPDVEDAAKPVDEKPVDYFDFATLHELGHSVDENVQFMESHAGQAEYGGWKSYGGKLEPIAAAVAKWAGYDSTPEQRKYVLDLILGNNATPPATTADKQAAWNAGLKKVTDWYALAHLVEGEGIWWSQAGCNKITIDKVIYHEAYKGTWVSYLAKARSQGITGYQFRAPGEWFAELYASYRIGKLKKNHPAVKWLSAIKL